MGLRFESQKYGACFFVTTSFSGHQKLGEIDGFYSALASSLTFCSHKYDAVVAGYVFMPSHIHLLLFINGANLGNLMRDFKKYISQKVAKDLGVSGGSVWMPRYDRVAVFSETIFRTKLNYIHENPVRKGLVTSPEDWRWSSARDYLSDSASPVAVWTGWG